MKKVLALVLAVMMLSTMAFAALNDTAEGGNVVPGGKIKFDREPGGHGLQEVGTSGAAVSFKDDDNGLDKALNTDNYSVGRIRYNEGRGLIDEIYIDDDEEQVVITFAQDYEYAKEKSFDIEFTLSGKGRDVDDVTVYVNGTVGYQHFVIGLDDDEFDLRDYLDSDNLNKGIVEFEEDGESYSTMIYDVDDLSMEVRVYDGDEFYLYCDTAADTDVLKANADADGDMYFYNFKGEPTFNSTAKLYFYNADEDCYVYENNNGRLTEVGKYDDDEGCWVVKARTLGSYVVSTEELVNADNSDTTEPDVENPDTGANDVVGIAAALGVVALVSAAAVSQKK